jgi:P-aminobenzoate N-oxygenase AurF
VCGIIGLFVGCPALAYCPRQQLLADQAVTGTETTMRTGDVAGSREFLRNWHERAALRAAPRRVLDNDLPDRYLFSPDLVPVAGHRLVRALPEPEFRKVITQHLYRYLDFTAKLESLVVNRTVLGIAHGTVKVDVPIEMRYDAYKIYCDEAYHTLMSADLALQVMRATGLTPKLPDFPYFLRRLAQLQEQTEPLDRPLVELLFVVISETLISATLAALPKRDNVAPAVQDMISDHALDEGRHHAYFAAFLRLLWSQLSVSQQQRSALWVPQLIDAFLKPDVETIQQELMSYGMSRSDAELVLHDVYAPAIVEEQRSAMARQTLSYFEELGAFASAQAQDALAMSGYRSASTIDG